ncbi:MAG TPA: patatin-like phospholipase family protein [bacterium]|nr:patatin-like phospholipase family protein [bacterium]HPT29385.1 patatin-like phospholipase family protein [bacterium]
MPRPKIGLALGSGGFRGPALVGVIDTLLENNIPIDYIAGSSIGALVGAYYAVYGNSERLRKDFFGKQKEKLRMLTDISRAGGLLTGSYLEKFLRKGLEGADFKKTKIPIKIIATNIITGEPYIFDRGDMATAVRASVSVPLTFKPVKFRGQLLVDGGISLPVPDEIVKSMGADIIIAVNLYNQYDFVDASPSTSKTVMRCIEIILRRLAQNEIKNSDIIIEPDTSNLCKISRLKKYWDDKIMLNMMESGRAATLKALPEIKKRLGI